MCQKIVPLRARQTGIFGALSLGAALARLDRSGAKIMGPNCMNEPLEMLGLLRQIPTEFVLAVYPNRRTASVPGSSFGL